MQMQWYTNSYGDEFDKDKFITLQSLMKNNKGQWKSDKQAKFLMKKWCMDREDINNGNWVATFIPDNAGKQYIAVDGFITQSHGARGHVPVTYLYEVDTEGVVKRYRLRYERFSRGGYSPKSIEVDWER